MGMATTAVVTPVVVPMAASLAKPVVVDWVVVGPMQVEAVRLGVAMVLVWESMTTGGAFGSGHADGFAGLDWVAP